MKVPEGFKTRIGGDVYEDTPNLVVCLGQPVLRVDRDASTGRLLVELVIFDSKGTERARVKKTRLKNGKSSQYSLVETDYNVTVRDATNDRTICELQRRDPTSGAELDAYLLTHAPNGFLVHASPAQSNLTGKTSGKHSQDLDAALVMEERKRRRKKQ